MGREVLRGVTRAATVETIFKGVEDLNPRVPIADLVTTARFEAERDKIFRRSWLHVAHERELTEPGSYVVKEVPPLAVSLLIMRGQDGAVRGFHNVCTHRGNKIAPTGSSGCKKNPSGITASSSTLSSPAAIWLKPFQTPRLATWSMQLTAV